MKLIKIILTYFISLCMIYTIPIKAEEIISYPNTWINVELISGNIQTSYKSSDYSVVYKTEGNKYIAYILDKNGNQVSIFSETIEGMNIQEVILLKNANLFNAVASNSYETTMDGLFNLIPGRTEFQAYVWARMKISSGSYWRQCDQLLGYGHSAGNSGAFTLEGSQSFDGTASYPTGKVSIDINGVIQTSSSSSGSLGLSFEALQGLGFKMSGTSTSTWYARKTYNTSATFTLMS